MASLGKQLAIELYCCEAGRLDDVEFIRQAMLGSARVAGAQIVTDVFHRFSPQGISGVVIITESHLAIHTWPEYAYAAVDLFTCGDMLASDEAVHYLRERLGAKRVTVVTLPRGPRITGEAEGRIETRLTALADEPL